MTTVTVAAPYASVILAKCVGHPGKACVELELIADHTSEKLSYKFTTLADNEPTHIGVIEGLLLGCKPYKMPSGFDVLNGGQRLHVFYAEDTDVEVLGEAMLRLKARLVHLISEIMDARNATFRHDPTTRLVHER